MMESSRGAVPENVGVYLAFKQAHNVLSWLVVSIESKRCGSDLGRTGDATTPVKDNPMDVFDRQSWGDSVW